MAVSQMQIMMAIPHNKNVKERLVRKGEKNLKKIIGQYIMNRILTTFLFLLSFFFFQFHLHLKSRNPKVFHEITLSLLLPPFHLKIISFFSGGGGGGERKEK